MYFRINKLKKTTLKYKYFKDIFDYLPATFTTALGCGLSSPELEQCLYNLQKTNYLTDKMHCSRLQIPGVAACFAASFQNTHKIVLLKQVFSQTSMFFWRSKMIGFWRQIFKLKTRRVELLHPAGNRLWFWEDFLLVEESLVFVH